MKNLLSLCLLLFLVFFSCEKEKDTSDDPTQELVFQSLNAGKYLLVPGETITIVAKATGYNLSYHWSATAGDLLIVGTARNEAIYAPSPCHVGENEISCEVQDGNNNSETKTITIVVE